MARGKRKTKEKIVIVEKIVEKNGLILKLSLFFGAGAVYTPILISETISLEWKAIAGLALLVGAIYIILSHNINMLGGVQ